MKISCIVLVVTLSLGLLWGATACASKDTTPPTVPTNLKYEISNDNFDLVFSWDAATDKGSGVEGYLAKVSWDNMMSEYWVYNGPSTSFSVPVPKSSGTYTFEVEALDKAGNESTPAILEFQWDAAP